MLESSILGLVGIRSATADADASDRDAVVTRAHILDGGLAAGSLATVVAIARRRGVRARPGSALAGALGAIALEWVLGRRHETVRRFWERPRTKVAAVVGLAGLSRIAAIADEDRTLSAVAGGLAGYLAILVLVAGGVVPPPREW